MKRALVMGAGGFIGGHMVKRLKAEGYWVTGVDIKMPEFSNTNADEFVLGDLTDPGFVEGLVSQPSIGNFDEIYQFAADMGGAGYIFSGENDANIMHNSATINLNVLNTMAKSKVQFGDSFKTKIFYSSSACMYPEHNQLDPDNPNLEESSAYPANPDSEYGWEKLFSERLYLAFSRNFDIEVAIARYHNIYGPEGTWQGGREKAPAAICRKILESQKNNHVIEIWGDGQQTRSFLFIDDCIEATRRLMKSNFSGPVNIGSEEMVTINKLVDLAGSFENLNPKRKYIREAPVGVRGRNSDNNLIRTVLKWDYEVSLKDGLRETYFWIKNQIEAQK